MSRRSSTASVEARRKSWGCTHDLTHCLDLIDQLRQIGGGGAGSEDTCGILDELELAFQVLEERIDASRAAAAAEVEKLEGELDDLREEHNAARTELRSQNSIRLEKDRLRQNMLAGLEDERGALAEERRRADAAAEELSECREELDAANNARFYIIETVRDTIYSLCASVSLRQMANRECPVRHLEITVQEAPSSLIDRVTPPPPKPPGERRYPCGDWEAVLTEEMERNGVSQTAQVSPIAPVTMDDVEKNPWLPPAARAFIFAYPLIGAHDYYTAREDSADTADMFAANGGFVYLTPTGEVVGARAVSQMKVNTASFRKWFRKDGAEQADRGSIQFKGPYKWDRRLTRALWRAGRFMPTSLPRLRELGVTYFCWVGPDESIDAEAGCDLAKEQGEKLGKDVQRRMAGAGSFVFLFGQLVTQPRELKDFAPGDGVVHSERGFGTIHMVNEIRRTVTVTFGEDEQHTYAEGKLRAGRLQPVSALPDDVLSSSLVGSPRNLPDVDPRDAYFTLECGLTPEELNAKRAEQMKEQNNKINIAELHEVNEALEWLNQNLASREADWMMQQQKEDAEMRREEDEKDAGKALSALRGIAYRARDRAVVNALRCEVDEGSARADVVAGWHGAAAGTAAALRRRLLDAVQRDEAGSAGARQHVEEAEVEQAAGRQRAAALLDASQQAQQAQADAEEEAAAAHGRLRAAARAAAALAGRAAAVAEGEAARSAARRERAQWAAQWRELSGELQREFHAQLTESARLYRHAEQRAAGLQRRVDEAEQAVAALQGQLRLATNSAASPTLRPAASPPTMLGAGSPRRRATFYGAASVMS